MYGSAEAPPRALRNRRARRRGATALAAAALAASVATGCADGRPSTREEAGVSPRVVAMVPSLAEITIALGAAEHLVARTDYDDDPALTHLPSVGGGLDPSYEALVGLDVEVVLMTVAREAAAMEARLDALGIEMLMLPANTVEDVYGAIDRLGALLGRESQAAELSASLRAGFTELEARLAGTERVDVMYVLGSDPPMTTGGGTFVDELVRLAGGRTIFDDAPAEWPTVGFETIVARDPDVIVWPQGRDGTATVAKVRAMPGWRDVPAVRAGRIVFIDAASFNQPGPGMVASARALAQVLHPEAF